MSFLQVNELTPNAKLLTGCGDGLRNEPVKQAPIRSPIPSCRRFSTRPSPTHQNDHADVKIRLQTAIQELATHPNITRRRALTMAEITPTRRLSVSLDALQLSEPGVRRINPAHSKNEDAGRRVYQVLLLNVWRQRRMDVAKLTDSLGALQDQNNKLEMQIDALRRLRQAESNKRTEAANENQQLLVKMEEILQDKRNLNTEKIALEKQIIALEQKEKLLQLDAQNARNDWMTVRCELRSSEQQLSAERLKIKKLRDEKVQLLDKLSLQEQEFRSLSYQIEELQERLLHTEVNLQDTILSNTNYEDNMKELNEKINVDSATNAELQNKIQDLMSTKEKLEKKLQDFRKASNTNREIIKKIDQENQMLKKDLITAKSDLKREQARPWWRNAGELALAPLNALQNAAYIMLPAMPLKITRSTSTTDIPISKLSQ